MNTVRHLFPLPAFSLPAFPLLAALGLSLSACAGPPLQLYTLAAPATAGTALSGPAVASLPTVEVRRVGLPDYLDTQDIVVRHGETLERSPNGRWAERLSNGITDQIVARVGAARPDLFLTQQSLTGASSGRLVVTITRLDIAGSGQATLEADWAFVPADEKRTETVERGIFHATGPIGTDADTVALTASLIAQLGDSIARALPRL